MVNGDVVDVVVVVVQQETLRLFDGMSCKRRRTRRFGRTTTYSADVKKVLNNIV